MLRKLFVLAASFDLFCVQVLAQVNYFVNPPVPDADGEWDLNPVWRIGDTQNITWSTDFDKISMMLWQIGNESSPQYLVDWTEWPQYLVWSVNIDGVFDLSHGNIFYFQIWQIWANDSKGEEQFSSHKFNITDGSDNATAPSETPSASPYPSSSATATLVADSATSMAEASDDNDLSTSAAIGIGVGVGVSSLALILAGLFFYHRKRRTESQKKSLANSPSSPEDEDSTKTSTTMVEAVEASPTSEILEAPGSGHVAEMPASKSILEAPGSEQIAEVPAPSPVELESDQLYFHELMGQERGETSSDKTEQKS